MIELSDIRYVKRICVGTSDPARMLSEDDIEQAMALLNRCLNGPSGGRIIGIEKSFKILNIGEHQAVLQWIVYHVGFIRKPIWLND